MRRLGLVVLVGLVFGGGARAQTQATAASSAQVSAGQAAAQTQSSTSARGSESAHSAKRKGEGKQASSATTASTSHSNSTSANAGPAAIELNSGTAVDAVLVNSLDARKSKPGDKIEARTVSDVRQDGQVVLKKGSRLHGHVTEAQARSKQNAASSLGMAFDSVTLKNGHEIPLQLGVEALASASSETAAALGDDEGMIGAGAAAAGSGRAGSGLVGGAGGAVGGAAGAAGGVAGNAGRAAGSTVRSTKRAAGSATGNAGGLDQAGHLTSSSSGVFGLEGLSLNSAASNATQGSVVSSKTQNVHLESGTQLLLRAAKP